MTIMFVRIVQNKDAQINTALMDHIITMTIIFIARNDAFSDNGYNKLTTRSTSCETVKY